MNLNLSIFNSGVNYTETPELKKNRDHNFKHYERISRDQFLKIFDNTPATLKSDVIQNKFPISRNKFRINSIPSALTNHSFVKNIPFPLYIQSVTTEDKYKNEWKTVFNDFIPSNTKGSRTIEKWITLVSDNIFNFIESIAYDSNQNIYAELTEQFSESFFIDSPPRSSIAAQSIFYGSTNVRFSEEVFFLLMIIMGRELDEYNSNENSIYWIKELGYENVLTLPLPESFTDLSTTAINISNSFKPKHISLDHPLDIYLTVDHGFVDSPTYYIEFSYDKSSLSELKTYFENQSILIDKFYNILIEPCGDIYPVYATCEENYCDTDITLYNNKTNESLSGTDLYEREELFWKIFFNHYFPDHFKTNWIIKRSET